MRKLSREGFQRAGSFIMNSGRELEKARYGYLFCGASSKDVVDALQKYQNEDGGFGHGLEPDFYLPDSSPMASSIAFQVIAEIEGEGAAELIQSGIRYFERSFVQERKGWFAVPVEVNDHPHAPWWNYNKDEEMTIIDHNWGNPSAEIIGYLYKYRKYVIDLDVDELVEHAVHLLLKKEEYRSEHEIYCYIRLFKMLPEEVRRRMEGQLTTAVQSLVSTTPSDWKEYSPEPTKFVNAPSRAMFGLEKAEIDRNLDYLIGLLETNGAIYPNWKWGQYEADWKQAQLNWTGVVTLRVLRMLAQFGRIS